MLIDQVLLKKNCFNTLYKKILKNYWSKIQTLCRKVLLVLCNQTRYFDTFIFKILIINIFLLNK